MFKELKEIHERFKELVRNHTMSGSFVSVSLDERPMSISSDPRGSVGQQMTQSEPIFQEDNFEQIANEEREEEIEGTHSHLLGFNPSFPLFGLYDGFLVFGSFIGLLKMVGMAFECMCSRKMVLKIRNQGRDCEHRESGK